jgi:hypothetical protein
MVFMAALQYNFEVTPLALGKHGRNCPVALVVIDFVQASFLLRALSNRPCED